MIRWAGTLLLVLAVAATVEADQGCFDCVIDYDDCQDLPKNPPYP